MITDNRTFASDFFNKALANDYQRSAHAYMLTGSDSLAQYDLAINIAKKLNCKTANNNVECNCLNCQWIEQNRHPAVITVSPIDYTYANEKSKKMSVISANQAKYLKNELCNSSNYHRVVIFTDAVDEDKIMREYNYLWKSYPDLNYPVPTHTEDESQRTCWLPRPLSKRTFQAETANSLLKSIEEPSENVTFFFLVKDKEEMLDTIVSRCQCIPVLNKEIYKPILMNEDVINNLRGKAQVKTYTEALYLSEYILEITKEYSLFDIFDVLQNYYMDLIKSDLNYISYCKNHINNIEEAKVQLKFNVNQISVIESLCYSFVKKS